jgi:NAD(P)-dependent dehydrogenase (short-subunit alcohol dehydrogenase family)
MLRRAVESHPGCDGIVLGGHGLFTWGETQRACYANSIRIIDQMGEFIDRRRRAVDAPAFGGPAASTPVDRESVVAELLPVLRGVVSSNRRTVAHWDGSDDALGFANAAWAADLSALGTSCPDHFLRTRICPMFVPWDAGTEPAATLHQRVRERAAQYRDDYAAYYRAFADDGSPRLRDANPSVVVIPSLGIFGFAKDAREARITAEFFVNAIHVMDGATVLGDAAAAPPFDSRSGRPEPGRGARAVPQARRPEQAGDFTSFRNYVALPRREAFRIEYWALEEAKLQRQPAEREFSRKVALVVGAGSGIGREVALQIARRGGHVIAADRDLVAAEDAAAAAVALSSADMVMACEVDLASRASIRAALRAITLRFGGVDCVINTAAIYPTPDPSTPAETVWSQAMAINVSSNHVLAQEAGVIFQKQNLPASIVLTSSANAVVPKSGSEPYDVSKAAINHLIRELAIGLGPNVRVNGIAPATVVAGSSMFPRDRVIRSLRKYDVAFSEEESTESLRTKLAEFYARRTITRRPILPADCANAICWLAGDQSAKTTGHVIPIDGGLPEAFLR